MTEAKNHIGSYVEFLFYPGWEEPETIRGYLTGVSHDQSPNDPRYVMHWLHISDNKELQDWEDEDSLGGFGVWSHETFKVVQPR